MTATQGAETVTTVRNYVTRDNKFVAVCATDGETYWLVDAATGARISGFCANRAQVTIAAARAFGPMAWTNSVGSFAWGCAPYPYGQ